MGNQSSVLPESATNRHVVIIGAGYGGVHAAKLLEASGFDVTLVEKKPFFFHAVGSVRIPAVKGWVSEVAFPLDKLLKRPNSKLVVATAKHIDPVSKTVDVWTESPSVTTSIKYDYIIAAGGDPKPTAFPTRVPDHVKSIDAITKLADELFEQVQTAKNIVVVGGGPVGVEFATELRHQYPDKAITVVNSGLRLFNNSVPGLLKETTDAILEKIKSQNIEVLINEYVLYPKDPEGKGVIIPADKKVTTASGKTMTADLVFFATGNGTGVLKSLPYPKNWLDDHRHIKVNPFLQVTEAMDGPNAGTAFAIGDITDLPETKLAFYAKNHAMVVCANICALATSSLKSTPAKLKVYEAPKQAVAFVLLGPKDGAVEMGGAYKGWVGKQMAIAFKGKDYMADRYRADLNLK